MKFDNYGIPTNSRISDAFCMNHAICLFGMICQYCYCVLANRAVHRPPCSVVRVVPCGSDFGGWCLEQWRSGYGVAITVAPRSAVPAPHITHRRPNLTETIPTRAQAKTPLSQPPAPKRPAAAPCSTLRGAPRSGPTSQVPAPRAQAVPSSGRPRYGRDCPAELLRGASAAAGLAAPAGCGGCCHAHGQ